MTFEENLHSTLQMYLLLKIAFYSQMPILRWIRKKVTIDLPILTKTLYMN